MGQVRNSFSLKQFIFITQLQIWMNLIEKLDVKIKFYSPSNEKLRKKYFINPKTYTF